jgi:hypothetical protein
MFVEPFLVHPGRLLTGDVPAESAGPASASPFTIKLLPKICAGAGIEDARTMLKTAKRAKKNGDCFVSMFTSVIRTLQGNGT